MPSRLLALVALLVGLAVSGCSQSTGTAVEQSSTTEPTTTQAPTTTSSTTTTLARLPLSGKVIAIDAGHNGGNFAHSAEINQLVDAGNGVTKACDTSGTASNDGYAEYEFTL